MSIVEHRDRANGRALDARDDVNGGDDFSAEVYSADVYGVDGDSEEAVVVRPPKSVEHRFTRNVLSGIAVIQIMLVLFVGGTGQLVRLVGQIAVFTLAAAVALKFIRDTARPAGLRTARLLIWVGVMCLLWPVCQIVPLPLGVVSVLSPSTADYFKIAGSTWASISLSLGNSIETLMWLIALWLLTLVLITLPSSAVRLGHSRRHRERRVRMGTKYERARDVDRVVEFCQTTILVVATVAACISLGHLIVGASAYWGVFSWGADELRQLRSHWPFINPNHLCVLLEMGSILALTRYFRTNELKLLRDPYRQETGIGLRLLRQPERIGIEMWYLVLVLFLLLSAILTFSRAGIFVLLSALGILWIKHDRVAQTLRLSERRERRHSRVDAFLESKLWKIIRMPIAMTVALVVLFSFVGEGARDLLAKRIEYGLLQDRAELRWHLFQSTWQLIKDFPLTGVGLSSWSDVVGRYAGANLAAFTLDFAHNDPLQLVAEVGLLGLVGVIAATVRIAAHLCNGDQRPARQAPPNQAVQAIQAMQVWGLAIALIAPVVHSFFDFPFHVPALAFSITVLFALNLRQAAYLRGEYRAIREVEA